MNATKERKQIEKMADYLVRSPQVHFNKAETIKLLKNYKNLCENNVRMDRMKFRDVLHDNFNITDDVMMDRIFRTFDRDNDSYLSQEEWVKGMAIFLRGTTEERTRFCFSIYDINADGMISREEMFQFLKPTIIKPTSEEDADEGIRDLVEMCVKKLDCDHDNRVSFEDFESAIADDNLLLEVLGACLPSDKFSASYQEGLFREETEDGESGRKGYGKKH